MDPHFQRIFGDAGVRMAWFTRMIQSALVATVTGVYHPFMPEGSYRPLLYLVGRGHARQG